MKLSSGLFVLLFGISTFLNAQTTEGPSLGNGIFNIVGKDSTFSMRMGLQLQFQGASEWTERNNSFTDTQSQFIIRRARLKFYGFVYSPKLTYKIALGLSNRDMSGASVYTNNAPRYIVDAVMKWNFYENFELWFGQTKLPGDMETLTSSGNLQLVDRSLMNKSFGIDRDLGLQIHHKIKLSDKMLLKEAFAISQGEGRNVTSGNFGGNQYTSRLEFYPLGDFIKGGAFLGGDIYREPTPKLAFGVAYDFNDNAVKSGSNQGRYMVTDTGFHETDISTLFIDALVKYQGFSLMAEYADRSADDAVAKNSDGTTTGDVVEVGSGFNLQMGYVFENNWEVTGRYSNLNPEKQITGDDVENQYTFGVSKYILGHKLKVQTDLSYLNAKASEDQLMFRLQFAVHF
ncbi:phosphate-selective porin O/P [Gelidibacter sediminis]|uniref:Phosphate-selective porin O/P n=1 Tax=Gelidibacter sediminis TaxID=1608710 RepID=A0A4R7Q6N7_9FLAO|nr:porin [Gelidibacter sediminis]TDU43234.1 phosphate-selective porin O/P [Gelidibacter sediminis]